MTTAAVYTLESMDVVRYELDGTQNWTAEVGQKMNAVNAVSSPYVYVAAGDTVRQVDKSGGTVTSFSYTAAASINDIETGPENYVYIDDGSSLTILDSADGPVVLQHMFSAEVADVEVESGVAYVVVGKSSLKKFDTAGLP